jgi:hypothetical protein
VSAEFEKGGRQDQDKLKAAQNKLAQKTPTQAMILPFPSLAGDAKIDLLDLHTNKTLFSDLKECFPTLEAPKEKSRRSRNLESANSAKLTVHKVGSYNVSIARSLEDLRRY